MFDNNVVYPVTYVGGHPFLFSNFRHKPEDIPEGFVSYEVADAGGEGCFARIQKHVDVNFWGTIIGTEELELDGHGQYLPVFGSDEYEGSYHEYLTIHEYIAKEFPEREMAEAQQVIDAENAVFAGHKYQFGVTVIPGKNSANTAQAIIEACSPDMQLVLDTISENDDGECHIMFAAKVSNDIRLLELIDRIQNHGIFLLDSELTPLP